MKLNLIPKFLLTLLLFACASWSAASSRAAEPDKAKLIQIANEEAKTAYRRLSGLAADAEVPDFHRDRKPTGAVHDNQVVATDDGWRVVLKTSLTVAGKTEITRLAEVPLDKAGKLNGEVKFGGRDKPATQPAPKGVKDGSVSGKVLDADGKPLADATIRVILLADKGKPGEILEQTTSAADGSFKIRSLPEGSFALSTWKFQGKQPPLVSSGMFTVVAGKNTDSGNSILKPEQSIITPYPLTP